MNIISGKTKNKFAGMFAAKSWGKRRTFPNIAEKSFNKLWKEKGDKSNKG